MSGIETLLNTLPGHWAIIALIAGIGIAVIFLRGLLRFIVRAFLIGAVGFILLAAVYYVLNYTNFSL
jgi:hypothetical protein